MAFNLYDEVVPYVFGANNQDIPLSTYIDGTPKHFTVQKSKLLYDGCTWQELTLLEKSQENID